MTANLTEEELTAAIEGAKGAKSRAYCPYSKFPVGAAVVTKCGRVFYGCNVENAAYGGTICAERTAIGAAVSRGYREFKAVVVTTDCQTCVWPCGACRQFLIEFVCDSCEVIILHPDGTTAVKTMGELQPFAFKKDALLG